MLDDIFEKAVDACNWRMRVKLVLMSLACKVQRVTITTDRGAKAGGWYDWKNRIFYLTYVKGEKL